MERATHRVGASSSYCDMSGTREHDTCYYFVKDHVDRILPDLAFRSAARFGAAYEPRRSTSVSRVLVVEERRHSFCRNRCGEQRSASASPATEHGERLRHRAVGPCSICRQGRPMRAGEADGLGGIVSFVTSAMTPGSKSLAPYPPISGGRASSRTWPRSFAERGSLFSKTRSAGRSRQRVACAVFRHTFT